MAKGKSIYLALYCGECKSANKTTTYNKTQDTFSKERNMYCPKCRKHVLHKGKEIKKAN